MQLIIFTIITFIVGFLVLFNLPNCSKKRVKRGAKKQCKIGLSKINNFVKFALPETITIDNYKEWQSRSKKNSIEIPAFTNDKVLIAVFGVAAAFFIFRGGN